MENTRNVRFRLYTLNESAAIKYPLLTHTHTYVLKKRQVEILLCQRVSSLEGLCQGMDFIDFIKTWFHGIPQRRKRVVIKCFPLVFSEFCLAWHCKYIAKGALCMWTYDLMENAHNARFPVEFPFEIV